MGYGQTNTAFGYVNRLKWNAKNKTYEHSPQLKCLQKNDAFTVNDEKYGNAATKFPIGLITADELALVGSNFLREDHIKNYLYEKIFHMFTFSPAFNVYNIIGSRGSITYNEINYPSIIKPVINLSPKFVDEMVGAGTIDDPYRVE